MMFFMLTEVFGLNISDTAMAMGSATTFLVVGNFLGGKICARIGWWHTFVGSQILFIISLFSATLNSTFIGFIICIYLSCLLAGVFLVCFTLGTLTLASGSDKAAALSLGYMFFNVGYAVGVASAGLLFQVSYKWVFYFDCLANLVALCIFIVFLNPPELGVACNQRQTVLHKTGLANGRTKLFLFLLLLVHGGFAFLLPLGVQQSTSSIAPATLYGWLIAFSALVTLMLSPYMLRATRSRKLSSNFSMAALLYIASYFFLHLSGFEASFSIVSVLLWGCAGMLMFTYGEILMQRSAPAPLSGAAAAAFQSLIQMGAVAGPLLAGQLSRNFSFLTACAAFGIVAALATRVFSEKNFIDLNKDI